MKKLILLTLLSLSTLLSTASVGASSPSKMQFANPVEDLVAIATNVSVTKSTRLFGKVSIFTLFKNQMVKKPFGCVFFAFFCSAYLKNTYLCGVLLI